MSSAVLRSCGVILRLCSDLSIPVAFFLAALLDDQHVLAVLLEVVFDSAAAVVERDVGFGGLAPGDPEQLLVERLAVGPVDVAHGGSHFAQVAEEDVPALPFVFDPLAA